MRRTKIHLLIFQLKILVVSWHLLWPTTEAISTKAATGGGEFLTASPNYPSNMKTNAFTASSLPRKGDRAKRYMFVAPPPDQHVIGQQLSTLAPTQSQQVKRFMMPEGPASSRREPKWMDACNKRSLFNETLIDIIIGPQTHHPSDFLEADRRQRGKFKIMRSGQQQREAGANKTTSSVPPKFSPPSLMNEEDQASEKKSSDQVDHHERELRSKRSIITSKRSDSSSANKLQQEQLAGNLLDEKSAILFKAGPSNNGAKKTSFAFMGGAGKLLSKVSTGRNFHSSNFNPLEFNGNSIVSTGLSPTPTPPRTTTTTTIPPTRTYTTYAPTTTTAAMSSVEHVQSNQQYSEAELALFRAIDGIVGYNIKVSWSINWAISSAISLRRMIANLKNKVSDDIWRADVNQGLIDSVLEKRRWLPKFDSLTIDADNQSTGQLVGGNSNTSSQHDTTVVQNYINLGSTNETQDILHNISHHLQFFNVALEQIVFEQSSSDRRYLVDYKELERTALKVLCDIENLVNNLKMFSETKQALYNLMKQASISTLQEIRDQTKRNNLKSIMDNSSRFNRSPPIKSAYAVYMANDGATNSTGSTAIIQTKRTAKHTGDRGDNLLYIGREVMPAHQRRLTPLERSIRDQSILEDFEKLIGYYESVLASVHG